MLLDFLDNQREAYNLQQQKLKHASRLLCQQAEQVCNLQQQKLKHASRPDSIFLNGEISTIVEIKACFQTVKQINYHKKSTIVEIKACFQTGEETLTAGNTYLQQQKLKHASRLASSTITVNTSTIVEIKACFQTQT